MMMNGEEDEEEQIERELADVTFGELQMARANGSHSVYEKPNLEKKEGRANKNRPMEVSSKRPVPRFREVVQAPKKVIRDPRFESLCGKLDEDGKTCCMAGAHLLLAGAPGVWLHEISRKKKFGQRLPICHRFRKRYDFLFESKLPAERQGLRKKLNYVKTPKAIDEIKNRISWIDKQLKSASVKRTDANILSEHKKKEREAANKGKQPYYLKKSEIRKQRLIGKYNELKASGKLEAFIEKKRRKNASKDHRFMPYRRSDNSGQSSQSIL